MLKGRVDKVLHLAREMRLAFRIAQFAPTDDDARIIIRHLVIRAENFIEHVRALRRPLRNQGYNTQELKRITNAYADFFDEYLVVTRHKLGAHVQDFDFGQRLELWNSIDASKSEFFAEGAVEIYRCLMSLGLPDYRPYDDFPELGQIEFATSLAGFRASGDQVARVEIGADSLALSRPNTTAMLNNTTVHARAAQVALLHRWITRGDAFMALFEAYPNVLRIFKARLVTDVVGCCDCLFTRPVSANAPQYMDGLDTILSAEGFPDNALTRFAKAYDIVNDNQLMRNLRDKIGGHFEIDTSIDLAALLQMIDDMSPANVASHYWLLRQSFEKACRDIFFLRSYLASGQVLNGILPGEPGHTVPFESTGKPVGRITAQPWQFDDTDIAYATALEDWIAGDATQRSLGRNQFWEGFSKSEIIETITIDEQWEGGGSKTHVHEFRKAHAFILSAMQTETDECRFGAIMEMVDRCARGYPGGLVEVLMRFVWTQPCGKYYGPVAYYLGKTAHWYDHRVKAFLRVGLRAKDPSFAIWSRIALFKIFIRDEGLNRINPPRISRYSIAKIEMLTAGFTGGSRLCWLIVITSQFCDPDIASLCLPFEAEYQRLREEIRILALEIIDMKDRERVSDMLEKLLQTHDFVGVCGYLFDEFQNGPFASLGTQLNHLACGRVIPVADHDSAVRNLCGCYLRQEDTLAALQVAEQLAKRNPDVTADQVLRFQILCLVPERKAEAISLIRSLLDGYRLEASQRDVVVALERNLLSPN